MILFYEKINWKAFYESFVLLCFKYQIIKRFFMTKCLQNVKLPFIYSFYVMISTDNVIETSFIESDASGFTFLILTCF